MRKIPSETFDLKKPVESWNDKNKKITVEIVYALPSKQEIISMEVNTLCTVEQAINQSKILEAYPELDLESLKVGIFSKRCKLIDSLHDFDRIEIYRPLVVDPKQARKNRANKL